MAVDLGNIVATWMPVILNSVMMIIVGGGLLAVFYFLFVVPKKRKWLVDIWESKADGRLYLVAQDTLYEHRYNKNKSIAYLLKNAKAEVVPPPVECVQRYRGKEYVSYLRLLNDFIPMRNEIRLPDKEIVRNNVFKITKALKENKEKIVTSMYIYAPLKQNFIGDLNYVPMDYDVSLMMVNTQETMDKIYYEKLDFWQKYGTMIAIGVVVVLVIIAMWMSYEYGKTVITTVSGQVQQIATPLQNIAERISGTPPPS